jgi:hypothetical protein
MICNEKIILRTEGIARADYLGFASEIDGNPQARRSQQRPGGIK